MLTASATTASALSFSTVMKSSDSATYSKCAWESDPHLNAVPLKGKPGRNDTVYIYTRKGKFVFDAPVSVGSLMFLYAGDISAEGKKFDINKGNFRLETSGSHGDTLNVTLTNSQVNVRGMLSFTAYEKYRGMGSIVFNLVNTRIDTTNGIMFSSPSYYLKPTKGRSGVEINMVGSSYIRTKGDIILDTILADSPDMHFRFVLNEENGKLPFISVKSGSVNGSELHVNVKGKLKKGVHPLFEVTGPKDPEGKFRAIYFNGKKVSLGDTVTFAGGEAVIKRGAADKKKDNDYILEVK